MALLAGSAGCGFHIPGAAAIHHDTKQLDALMPRPPGASATASGGTGSGTAIASTTAAAAAASTTKDQAFVTGGSSSTVAAAVHPNGRVSAARSLYTDGDLRAGTISAASARLAGTLSVRTVNARGTVRAVSAEFDTIEVGTIRSKSGERVKINGDVSITNNAAAASFLSIEEEQRAGGGWQIAYSENFDPAADGLNTAKQAVQWVPLRTSACATELPQGAQSAPAAPNSLPRSTDVFLGGVCQLAGSPDIDEPSASLSLNHLAPHDALRFQARAHFIDAWNHDSLFIKVDGEVVWIDSASTASAMGANVGLDVCGGPAADARLSQSIDIVIPHENPAVVVQVRVCVCVCACVCMRVCLARGLVILIFTCVG